MAKCFIAFFQRKKKINKIRNSMSPLGKKLFYYYLSKKVYIIEKHHKQGYHMLDFLSYSTYPPKF